jgi:hypothetical protein
MVWRRTALRHRVMGIKLMRHTLLLSALLGACVLLGGCMSEQLAERLQVQREQAALAAWRECSRPVHHRVHVSLK